MRPVLVTTGGWYRPFEGGFLFPRANVQLAAELFDNLVGGFLRVSVRRKHGWLGKRIHFDRLALGRERECAIKSFQFCSQASRFRLRFSGVSSSPTEGFDPGSE
jgi:hypothetical protein